MRFVVSSFSSCAAQLRYLIFIRVLCRTVAKRYIRKGNVQGRVWSKLSFEAVCTKTSTRFCTACGLVLRSDAEERVAENIQPENSTVSQP